MSELIKDGTLKKIGADELCELIQKEFAESFGALGYDFSKKKFACKLDKFIWTSDVDKALRRVVRERIGLETFYSSFPNIPMEMVKARERWHKGISSAYREARQNQTGIFRIRADVSLTELKKIKIPRSSCKKPVNIPSENNRTNWHIMCLNGSNIGVLYPESDIVGNPVRRALSDADFRGDDTIILTNILVMDLKKAGGPQKLGRMLALGDNINPDVFASPSYRERVKEILANSPMDKIIYRTAEDLLDDLLAGWKKIFTKPDKRLEYDRPIHVVLGINEEDLIKTIAYWEINFQTKQRQDELRSEISTIKSGIKKADKARNFKHANKLETELLITQKELALTTVTQVATQEGHRFVDYAKSLVVNKIERAIPNSKVIGMGTTYISIGNSGTIEINIPEHDRVTDTLLANYCKQYGPKVLREDMAKTVVICHPYSLNPRMTERQVDKDGKRGSSKVFVAPICVDDACIRRSMEHTVRKVHNVAKMAHSEQARTGVLRLNCVNGLVEGDIIPLEALESFEEDKYKKVRAGRKKEKEFYSVGPKYIWRMYGSDPHWGGRSKEMVSCKDTGERLGMVEAVFQMMRKAGLTKNLSMPVHTFSVPDDPVQGQNFNARVEPHPHQLPPHKIEQYVHNMRLQAERASDAGEVRRILNSIDDFYKYQIEKRGSDFPLDQMFQMIERHVESYVDVFAAILRRAEKAGLIVRGVGEFVNEKFGGFDTRNIGIINFGSGNHLAHTVNGEIIEGPFYAKYLRAFLGQISDFKKRQQFLEKAVVAPLYGGQSIGWGTIRVKHGYEYGSVMRSTPTRMAGWGDTLLGAVRNDPLRGNYSRIFNGRVVQNDCGDKHFVGLVITSYCIYHMCPAGVHTDNYGEHGFPPNSTGVSFVGLPADGPDSGPILLRILPYDVIKDFVEDNPRSFDWKAYLPNPA
ncbi:MAG: hypothetical protein HYS51_02225 [Candidatus Zambryskibacteria bacterium]|nr:hypothetical protein [Candidatus Zambryskibacteria bacterium]